VREVEGLVEMEALLPVIDRGEAAPASATRCLEFARLVRYKRRPAAAVRLCQEAFADEPALAEDLGAAHRYYAAASAAQAGCGHGEDAAKLDDPERARLRQQALTWLRADLALRSRQRTGDNPKERAKARAALQSWRHDPDLADVRRPEALARLPREEREAWQKLWADVDALLAR
jgi:hypothetical protein